MASNQSVARDPGLQPERTRLAWWRTLVSTFVADLLIFRAFLAAVARHDASPGLVLAAALALSATVALAAVAWQRRRALNLSGLAAVATVQSMRGAAFAVLTFACASSLAIIFR